MPITLQFCSTDFDPSKLDPVITDAYMPLIHKLVVDISNDKRLLQLGATVFLVGGHAVRFFTKDITHSNDIDAKIYVKKAHHFEVRDIVRRHMQKLVTHMHIHGNKYEKGVPRELSIEFVDGKNRPFQVRYRRKEISHEKQSYGLRKRFYEIRNTKRVVQSGIKTNALMLEDAERQLYTEKQYSVLASKQLTYDVNPLEFYDTIARVREQAIAKNVSLSALDLKVVYTTDFFGPKTRTLRFNFPILDIVISEHPKYIPRTDIVKMFKVRGTSQPKLLPVATLKWWCHDLVHMYTDPISYKSRLFAGKTEKDSRRLVAISKAMNSPPYRTPGFLTRVNPINTNMCDMERLEDTYRFYAFFRKKEKKATPYKMIHVRPFIYLLKKRSELKLPSDFQIGQRHMLHLMNLSPLSLIPKPDVLSTIYNSTRSQLRSHSSGKRNRKTPKKSLSKKRIRK